MAFSEVASAPTSSACSLVRVWLKSPLAMPSANSAQSRIGRAMLRAATEMRKIASAVITTPTPSCQTVLAVERPLSEASSCLAAASTTSRGSEMTTDHGVSVRPNWIGA